MRPKYSGGDRLLYDPFVLLGWSSVLTATLGEIAHIIIQLEIIVLILIGIAEKVESTTLEITSAYFLLTVRYNLCVRASDLFIDTGGSTRNKKERKKKFSFFFDHPFEEIKPFFSGSSFLVLRVVPFSASISSESSHTLLRESKYFILLWPFLDYKSRTHWIPIKLLQISRRRCWHLAYVRCRRCCLWEIAPNTARLIWIFHECSLHTTWV